MFELNDWNLVAAMAGLKLKPTEVDKKLDQKKVILQTNLFATKFIQKKLQFKEKIIGQWTIEKEERCNICWVNIKTGEEFTSCASCHNKFHTEHWRQWIIAKSTCPVCKVKPLL